jgi:hypothetical protein
MRPVRSGHGGVAQAVPHFDSERRSRGLPATPRSGANYGGALIDPPHLGQAPTDRPALEPYRENPPYGILGGTMETSASFEARLAPSSYPTPGVARCMARLLCLIDAVSVTRAAGSRASFQSSR